MIDFFTNNFLWIKMIHVFAVISWMVGIFYLPRLFVYHCNVTVGGEADVVFRVMERRLYRIIMVPAMIVSLVTGMLLILETRELGAGWFHLKLTAVLALVLYHHLLNRWRKQLSEGTCRHSSKFFRVINEIPTILLIIILICVILRPF